MTNAPYYLFLFASAGMFLVSLAVITVSLLEVRRRWQVRVGYHSADSDWVGHVSVFSIALIRDRVRGMSGLAIVVGIIAAAFLLWVFGQGVWHLLHITPEEFVREFLSR